MIEHLFAVGLALLAVALVFFVFFSINRRETASIKPVKQNKGDVKPQKSKKTKAMKDEKFDREAEALIAREIARKNANITSDTRNPQPPRLEEARKDKRANRPKNQPTTTDEAVEKKAQVDKMSGFHSVAGPPTARHTPQAAAPKPQFYDADLERKLSLFFSNINRKERKQGHFGPVEEQPTANRGATIIVKKNIANARSW
uniref:Uncharacterized protein n=1 Tax=Trypanosoma congolense (strain IL3000) TaxID=1068625 RepID=G0UU81_TRYCI|nr:conserved hypothetical protein [Trypanosoma congolense IL3000]